MRGKAGKRKERERERGSREGSTLVMVAYWNIYVDVCMYVRTYVCMCQVYVKKEKERKRKRKRKRRVLA